MIISRTPFRISFFGGGTDYPVWFKEHGGAVLGVAIDKYCYVAVRYRPPYFNERYRVIYSVEECVQEVEEIEHPCVREVIKFMNIKKPLEVIHLSDLPARKGIGASSSFAVGILNSLGRLLRKEFNPWSLACTAIHLEQDIIGDNVGCQDQWLAAHGGFRHVEFLSDGDIISDVVDYGELDKYIMVFDTGTSRIASQVVSEQIEQTPKRATELKRMYQMTYEGGTILKRKDYKDFGKLLHEAWYFKKRLSSKITSPKIDGIYSDGISAGAWGGKLLGAGGGGYMVFIVDPDLQDTVKNKLSKLKCVPIRFERKGSEIIYEDRT